MYSYAYEHSQIASPQQTSITQTSPAYSLSHTTHYTSDHSLRKRTSTYSIVMFTPTPQTQEEAFTLITRELYFKQDACPNLE